MLKSNRARLILAGFALLLAGMYLWAAGRYSFWEDEAFTVQTAQKHPTEILEVSAGDVHPPLFYLLAAGWGRVFGFTELGIRSLSTVMVFLMLGLTYLLARELFDEKLALLAAALAALSPFGLLYGSFIRYYAASAVLGLLVIWAVVRHLRSFRWVYLLVYALAGAALLYNQYSAAAVLVGVNLWWLWRWLRSSRKLAHLAQWLLAQAAILALFAPWLSVLLAVAGERTGFESGAAGLAFEMAKRIAYTGFVISLGENISPLNPVGWLGLAVTAVIAGYALVRNRKQGNLWFLLLVFVLVLVFNAAISAVAKFPLSLMQGLPRWVFPVFPLFAIWLAAGLRSFKPAVGWALAGTLLAVYCLGIFNYFTDRQVLQPIFAVPWRGIYTNIASQAGPDTVVICNYADYSCGYYARRYGFQPNYPDDWSSLSAQDPSQVWWIATARGVGDFSDETETEALNDLAQRYAEPEVYRYTPQDPSIRWLKVNVLQQDDYEYRVVVSKYSK